MPLDDLFEVIVVDGHWTDDTVGMARSLCPEVKMVLRDVNAKVTCWRAALQPGAAKVIVMVDAGGSTDSAEIARRIGVLGAQDQCHVRAQLTLMMERPWKDSDRQQETRQDAR